MYYLYKPLFKVPVTQLCTFRPCFFLVESFLALFITRHKECSRVTCIIGGICSSGIKDKEEEEKTVKICRWGAN